jgi:hypothetical protein
MPDEELDAVAAEIRQLDPTGERTARVLRDTLDQLYDGQRTGRYSWHQLHKTEKTHCGTLVEINLHREFEFGDGELLDYRIADIDVDCKYSQGKTWTIPPEAVDHICLLVTANDERSRWSMGLLRIKEERLNLGRNRDRKATLNQEGRDSITWLFDDAELPPNILLQLPRETVDKIMSHKSGQQRVNELFRSALGMRVGRGVVATVAQQADYMKRVRGNGGARTSLQPEGIIILGQFSSHKAIARDLGLPIPEHGESVSVRVTPAEDGAQNTADIAGVCYRLAGESDQITPAPLLPDIRRQKDPR